MGEYHTVRRTVRMSEVAAFLLAAGPPFDTMPEWFAGAAHSTIQMPYMPETELRLPEAAATAGVQPARGDDRAPLTTPEMAEAFDGICECDSAQWKRKLGDVNNHGWVLPARTAKGIAPKPSTWEPIVFACLLEKRDATLESLNKKFLKEPRLKPWLHDWQEKRREKNAFGQ